MKNWSNITHYKFKAIYENLQKYKYVCITDGDIVYKDKRFIDYCLENIDNYDFLIQNDTLFDDGKMLCSGFMFIRSNEKTLSVFDPEKTVSLSLNRRWDDQMYINSIRETLNYKTLPLNLFPNGKYYYNKHEEIEPYMIHFNWVVGHEKFHIMKKYNQWLIEDLKGV